MKADSIVGQSFLLRWFGFFQPPALPGKKAHLDSSSFRRMPRLTTLLKLISRGLLISTSCLLILEFNSDFIHALPGSTYGRNLGDPFLIRIISELQYCFYPLRAVLVLTLFLINHDGWTELYTNMNSFLESCQLFSRSIRAKLSRRLKILSLTLVIVTVLSHGVFVSLPWWSDLTGRIDPRGVAYTAFIRDNCYELPASLRACFNFVEVILLWGLSAEPTFILSQQVLISAVIFALLLLQALRAMEGEIKREICHIAEVVREDSDTDIQSKVALWMATYMAAQKLLDKLNETFSWILMSSVGCDVIVSLSLGAKLIQPHSERSTTLLIYFAASCGLFMSYATLLFLPFVLLHDKVSHFQWQWSKRYLDPKLLIFISIHDDVFRRTVISGDNSAIYGGKLEVLNGTCRRLYPQKKRWLMQFK